MHGRDVEIYCWFEQGEKVFEPGTVLDGQSGSWRLLIRVQREREVRGNWADTWLIIRVDLVASNA